MIFGEVKDGRPIIDMMIEGVTGLADVPTILDTGFNGELMLTYRTIDMLKLELLGQEGFIVANGEHVETDFFRAFIHWFDRRRVVGVLATNGEYNLLGMDLLSQCFITINVHKKTVKVETLR